MTKHDKSGRLRRRGIEPSRNRTLLAATSFLAASLGVAGGELADGTMRVANAAKVGAEHITHKHIAGVKYQDIKTGTKTPTGAATPQKSMGARKR